MDNHEKIVEKANSLFFSKIKKVTNLSKEDIYKEKKKKSIARISKNKNNS